MQHFPYVLSRILPARVRLIPLLGLACAALATAYIALMIVTVCLATEQTRLAAGMRDADSDVATIETSYYQKVAELDAADPYAAGYVQPKQVVYVAAARMPDVSYAGR